MSLIDVGAQCSHSNCTTIDFLPILCRCQSYFCFQHSAADAHDCKYANAPESLVAGHLTLQRCAVDKCNKPSLEAFIASDSDEGRTPAKCTHCNEAFCAEHRHPKSHSCRIQPAAALKNEAARALLAKNFPSTSNPKRATVAPRAPKIPTDPAKLAQYRKMELMKMRHAAVAVDPKDKTATVPLDDRRYFKVATDAQEKVFWVRKSLSTGRVLDLLAAQLGFSSGSSSLELLKVSETNQRVKCSNDQVFSSQVEDTDTVIVSRCE